MCRLGRGPCVDRTIDLAPLPSRMPKARYNTGDAGTHTQQFTDYSKSAVRSV